MNLRVIKKDIDFLVGDFVEDCIIFAMLHPNEGNVESVNALIEEAYDLQDALLDRVNQAPKADPKDKKGSSAAIRAHFKGVNTDLLKGLDALCEKLSALAAKK